MTRQNQVFCGFYKLYKLHKACSDNNLHPAMEYVAFKNGYAYATDTRVAVKANLRDISALSLEDVQKLNGYAIHKDQYAALLKFSKIEVCDGSITVKDATGKTQTIFQLAKIVENCKDERLGAIRFPDVESIITDDAKKDKIESIGISLKLLNNLAAAMGMANERIGLRFTAKAGKIFIIGEPGVDVSGVIMPVMID